MVGLWQSHHDIGIIITTILLVTISDSIISGIRMNDTLSIVIKMTTYKMLFALSCIIPFMLMDIDSAIRINITWGCILISYIGYKIQEKIFVNLFITLIVILLSYLTGIFIRFFLN